MLLHDKNAVIYGGAGHIGSAVAAAFAREGATVHLAGRTRETLERTATAITAEGGRADVAVVDAFDETAVDAHARTVAERGGSLDISLNLIARGDLHGVPLADMTTADLLRPVIDGFSTTVITARAAARRMTEQGSGVILALNSGSAYGSPMMGGTGPADAAIDVFIRNLARELGPRGVRALGIWAAGVPETLSVERLNQHLGDDQQLDEAAFQGVLKHLDEARMLPRSPSLDDIAATAVFLASDRAAAITGSFVNATGGMFPS